METLGCPGIPELFFNSLPNKEIREGHGSAEVSNANRAFGLAFECGFDDLRIGVLGFGEGGGGFGAVEFEAEAIPFAEFHFVRAEDDGLSRG